jgi:hypothetical protein
MTVTLKATGASDVVLCDGAAYAGTAGKFIGPLGEGVSETVWQSQPSPRVRAAARAIFDRLNAAHGFSLVVSVAFATEALATIFRLTWAASLPRTAAYLVVAHDSGTTQTFTPAVMTRCRIAQTGLGCLVEYAWETGAPTSA